MMSMHLVGRYALLIGAFEGAARPRVVKLDRILCVASRARLPAHYVSPISVRRTPSWRSCWYRDAGADIARVHAIDFLVDVVTLPKTLHHRRRRLLVPTRGGFFHTGYP